VTRTVATPEKPHYDLDYVGENRGKSASMTTRKEATVNSTPKPTSDSPKPGKPIRLIFPRGAKAQEIYDAIQKAKAKHSSKTPDATTTPQPEAGPDETGAE
jgi:hypothetical protein